MMRVQIQLDARRHREVKRRSKQLGVSVAEVVRRSLDRYLDEEGSDTPAQRTRRALAVIGKYTDSTGADRTARDHDAALAHAYRR